MRVFVSEFLCSGAWPEPDLNPSLVREGRAMLGALLADLARIPGCSPCTTWDARLGPCPFHQTEVHVAHSASEEWQQFQRLASGSDATYVIAPELDDVLTSRCRAVRELGARCLNSAQIALEVCSDKLATAAALTSRGIATIPTVQLEAHNVPPFAFPLVVKPRFGAGSQNTFLVTDMVELADAQSHFRLDLPQRQGIVQPYVRGRALSVAAIFGDDAECRDIFPVAEQSLSADGRFHYRGGRIPAAGVNSTRMIDLVRDAGRAVRGLRGYVGFDVLLPDSGPDRPVLVEINSRLTTSYLGYRALTPDNLAEPILFARPRRPITWDAATAVFDAGGEVMRDHTAA